MGNKSKVSQGKVSGSRERGARETEFTDEKENATQISSLFICWLLSLRRERSGRLAVGENEGVDSRKSLTRWKPSMQLQRGVGPCCSAVVVVAGNLQLVDSSAAMLPPNNSGRRKESLLSLNVLASTPVHSQLGANIDLDMNYQTIRWITDDAEARTHTSSFPHTDTRRHPLYTPGILLLTESLVSSFAATE